MSGEAEKKKGWERERKKKHTERQLLQRPSRSLREHEVDENDFEGKPAAVRDQIPPAYIVEADGVHEGGEEGGETAEQLESGNSAGSLGVRPELNEVGCRSKFGRLAQLDFFFPFHNGWRGVSI